MRQRRRSRRQSRPLPGAVSCPSPWLAASYPWPSCTNEGWIVPQFPKARSPLGFPARATRPTPGGGLRHDFPTFTSLLAGGLRWWGQYGFMASWLQLESKVLVLDRLFGFVLREIHLPSPSTCSHAAKAPFAEMTGRFPTR